ncbi:uncharacterized protein LOC110230902 [Arabidopsis lyrata subsp. lyrata]|uniref:uncharacterized protein LOC110230902 n=1 Tax=Arabidopsis lyrata subsp. lyrata TaxID=81972 RepID=UPI000A29B6ED|nr:uncharacterized protein LOC110230902 [Arabidopsis lyrata subsp. lyrata]|eukprot:XP_020890803.1 uncharacterized protein LOC110230902 [Arabidopsis lyrata subsp. lyrata]
MSSYIPIPLVTEILRRIGQYGFRELGPFIAAGPVWAEMVFSYDVCLLAQNNTAKYVEGLRRAAQDGPSVEILDMVGEAAVTNIHSRFAFGVLLVCCGSTNDGKRVLNTIFEKVPNFLEAVNIAEQVVAAIRDMGTPGRHTYRGFRGLIDIPECRLIHHTAPDVCPSCFALTYVFKISDLC